MSEVEEVLNANFFGVIRVTQVGAGLCTWACFGVGLTQASRQLRSPL